MNDMIREERRYYDSWIQWPVYWSALWVGALATLATALVLGLIAIAIGAQVVYADPWVETRQIGWGTVISAIVGSFLAFVVGGWVAGRIAGIRRSEPAMLHGAIVWLLAVPFLTGFAAFGAGSYFGAWYGGLAGTPGWAAQGERLIPPGPDAAEAEQERHQAAVQQANREARNAALGTVTALLLGLVGSVLGGWMASGQPMTITYQRKRQKTEIETPVHVGAS